MASDLLSELANVVGLRPLSQSLAKVYEDDFRDAGVQLGLERIAAEKVPDIVYRALLQTTDDWRDVGANLPAQIRRTDIGQAVMDRLYYAAERGELGEKIPEERWRGMTEEERRQTLATAFTVPSAKEPGKVEHVLEWLMKTASSPAVQKVTRLFWWLDRFNPAAYLAAVVKAEWRTLRNALLQQLAKSDPERTDWVANMLDKEYGIQWRNWIKSGSMPNTREQLLSEFKQIFGHHPTDYLWTNHSGGMDPVGAFLGVVLDFTPISVYSIIGGGVSKLLSRAAIRGPEWLAKTTAVMNKDARAAYMIRAGTTRSTATVAEIGNDILSHARVISGGQSGIGKWAQTLDEARDLLRRGYYVPERNLETLIAGAKAAGTAIEDEAELLRAATRIGSRRIDFARLLHPWELTSQAAKDTTITRSLSALNNVVSGRMGMATSLEEFVQETMGLLRTIRDTPDEVARLGSLGTMINDYSRYYLHQCFRVMGDVEGVVAKAMKVEAETFLQAAKEAGQEVTLQALLHAAQGGVNKAIGPWMANYAEALYGPSQRLPKLLEYMHSSLSVLFLAANPKYAIRNTMNNVFTALVNAEFALKSPDQMMREIGEIAGSYSLEYLRTMGTAASLHAIGTTPEEIASRLLNVKGAIKKAINPKNILRRSIREIAESPRAEARATPGLAEIAGLMEADQRLRVTYSAIQKFMGNYRHEMADYFLKQGLPRDLAEAVANAGALNAGRDTIVSYYRIPYLKEATDILIRHGIEDLHGILLKHDSVDEIIKAIDEQIRGLDPVVTAVADGAQQAIVDIGARWDSLARDQLVSAIGYIARGGKGLPTDNKILYAMERHIGESVGQILDTAAKGMVGNPTMFEDAYRDSLNMALRLRKIRDKFVPLMDEARNSHAMADYVMYQQRLTQETEQLVNALRLKYNLPKLDAGAFISLGATRPNQNVYRLSLLITSVKDDLRGQISSLLRAGYIDADTAKRLFGKLESVWGKPDALKNTLENLDNVAAEIGEITRGHPSVAEAIAGVGRGKPIARVITPKFVGDPASGLYLPALGEDILTEEGRVLPAITPRQDIVIRDADSVIEEWYRSVASFSEPTQALPLWYHIAGILTHERVYAGNPETLEEGLEALIGAVGKAIRNRAALKQTPVSLSDLWGCAIYSWGRGELRTAYLPSLQKGLWPQQAQEAIDIIKRARPAKGPMPVAKWLSDKYPSAAKALTDTLKATFPRAFVGYQEDLHIARAVELVQEIERTGEKGTLLAIDIDGGLRVLPADDVRAVYVFSDFVSTPAAAKKSGIQWSKLWTQDMPAPGTIGPPEVEEGLAYIRLRQLSEAVEREFQGLDDLHSALAGVGEGMPDALSPLPDLQSRMRYMVADERALAAQEAHRALSDYQYILTQLKQEVPEDVVKAVAAGVSSEDKAALVIHTAAKHGLLPDVAKGIGEGADAIAVLANKIRIRADKTSISMWRDAIEQLHKDNRLFSILPADQPAEKIIERLKSVMADVAKQTVDIRGRDAAANRLLAEILGDVDKARLLTDMVLDHISDTAAETLARLRYIPSTAAQRAAPDIVGIAEIVEAGPEEAAKVITDWVHELLEKDKQALAFVPTDPGWVLSFSGPEAEEAGRQLAKLGYKVAVNPGVAAVQAGSRDMADILASFIERSWGDLLDDVPDAARSLGGDAVKVQYHWGVAPDAIQHGVPRLFATDKEFLDWHNALAREFGLYYSGADVLAGPKETRWIEDLAEKMTVGVASSTVPSELSTEAARIAERLAGLHSLKDFVQQNASNFLDATRTIAPEELKRALDAYSTWAYAGLRYGVSTADFVMLNYSAQRQFDYWLRFLFLYPYWYTRTVPHWFAKILSDPQVLKGYMVYSGLSEWASKDLPIQYRGGFPIHIGDQIYYIDLAAMLNPLNNLAEQFHNEELEKTAGGRIYSKMTSWGPSPWPWWAILAYGRFMEDPSKAYISTLPFAPIIRAATALMRLRNPALGEYIPAGGIDLDAIFGYPIVSAVAGPGKPAVTDKPNTDRMTAEMLWRWIDEGAITLKEAQEALGTQNRLWQQAKDAAMAKRIWPNLSYLTGINVYHIGKEELEIKDARETWKKLLSRGLTGEAWDDAVDEFSKEWPFYLSWKTVYADPEERAKSYLTTVIYNRYAELRSERDRRKSQCRPGDSVCYREADEWMQAEFEKFKKATYPDFEFIEEKHKSPQELYYAQLGTIFSEIEKTKPRYGKYLDDEESEALAANGTPVYDDYGAYKQAVNHWMVTMPMVAVQLPEIRTLAYVTAKQQGVSEDEAISYILSLCTPATYKEWKRHDDNIYTAITTVYNERYYESAWQAILSTEKGEKPSLPPKPLETTIIRWVMEEYPGRWTYEQIRAAMPGRANSPLSFDEARLILNPESWERERLVALFWEMYYHIPEKQRSKVLKENELDKAQQFVRSGKDLRQSAPLDWLRDAVFELWNAYGAANGFEMPLTYKEAVKRVREKTK